MLRKILHVLAIGSALAVIPTVAWAASNATASDSADCCCPLCCSSK
jgi:hypothetical protein